MLLFKEAVRLVKLKPPYDSRDLIDRLHDGKEDPLIALLLMSLPNITSLKLEKVPEDSHIFSILVDFATTRSTIVPSQIEYDCIVGRMLGKVREVILSCDPEDDSGNMVFIKPFVLLPSIKKLSCWNMR